MIICDLSPHLGHKLGAAIHLSHVYNGYIVDPQDCMESIGQMLLGVFDEKIMTDYLSIGQSTPKKRKHSEEQTKIIKKKKVEEKSQQTGDESLPEKSLQKTISGKSLPEKSQQKTIGGKSLPEKSLQKNNWW